MDKYNEFTDKIDRDRNRYDFVTYQLNKSDLQKLQMLRSLRDMCKDCTICYLGRTLHTHNNIHINNQHVFSNMKISKFFLIGQNPGAEECEHDEPFIGISGKNFNTEISKYDLSRDMFWISNAVKCHTPENRKPTIEEASACENYLAMEIAILKPTLIIALGAFAFSVLCPNDIFGKSLGKITHSKFKIPVYATYHPSPRNLELPDRKKKFESDIQMMSKLVKKLLSKI